jgi:hypothetical protein
VLTPCVPYVLSYRTVLYSKIYNIYYYYIIIYIMYTDRNNFCFDEIYYTMSVCLFRYSFLPRLPLLAAFGLAGGGALPSHRQKK